MSPMTAFENLCAGCKHSKLFDIIMPGQAHGAQPVMSRNAFCQASSTLMVFPVIRCELYEPGTPMEQREIPEAKPIEQPRVIPAN